MAFQTGLEDLVEKVATVATEVKMYRRAIQGLRTGARSATLQVPTATKGFAVHGTEDLGNILSDRRLDASALGEHGQHGGGVYWWRGAPREHYLTSPSHEGILTDLETVGPKKKMMPNIISGHTNPHAVRTGPGDYQLRPKDYAVINYTGRREDKTLPGILADATDARLRKVDSGIFNQAYRDLIKNNLYNAGKQPEPATTSMQDIIKRFRK